MEERKINMAALMVIVASEFCCSSGLIHLPRALQRQDSEIVALSEGSSLSLPPIDFEQEVWEERIQQNSSIEPIEPDLKRDGEKFETIEPMELEMKIPLRLLEVMERGASRNTAGPASHHPHPFARPHCCTSYLENIPHKVDREI